jgi:hypothetical protein
VTHQIYGDSLPAPSAGRAPRVARRVGGSLNGFGA